MNMVLGVIWGMVAGVGTYFGLTALGVPEVYALIGDFVAAFFTSFFVSLAFSESY